jgi:CheY-like chemotaxis protein
MARGSILVIEDNDVMLEGIRDILEMADYQVLTALDGQEAWRVKWAVEALLRLSCLS